MISLPHFLCYETSPQAKLTSLASRTFCTAGMAYAPVLPLPVLARANTSFPSSSRGIALACTRVGCANFKSANARKSRASSEVENGGEANETSDLDSTSAWDHAPGHRPQHREAYSSRLACGLVDMIATFLLGLSMYATQLQETILNS